MKHLLLLRHAKSSWDDVALDDHQRPLNRRGRGDAPRVGRLLQRLNSPPEWIVCSTAERCRQTVSLAGWDGEGQANVQYDDRLYHAGTRQLEELVRQLPEPADCVMLVGHNPGLEDFASQLAGEFVRLPTATLACFALDLPAWHDLRQETRAAAAEVWRPKEYDI